jgi:hypothetical protein
VATETAFELDAEAAGLSGDEFVHFANFPGMWRPGQPVAAAELGFDSAEEAETRVAELGLPLLVVTVEEGSAPMPARPNHLLSETGLETLDAALDEGPKRLSHKDLDTLAAEAGVSFPADVKTVDAKTAFLEEARAAQDNPAEHAEPGAEG